VLAPVHQYAHNLIDAGCFVVVAPFDAEGYENNALLAWSSEGVVDRFPNLVSSDSAVRGAEVVSLALKMLSLMPL
jgi:hypothetical protein